MDKVRRVRLERLPRARGAGSGNNGRGRRGSFRGAGRVVRGRGVHGRGLAPVVAERGGFVEEEPKRRLDLGFDEEVLAVFQLLLRVQHGL